MFLNYIGSKSLSESELAGNWLQLPGFLESCDEEDSQPSCDESLFNSADAVTLGEEKNLHIPHNNVESVSCASASSDGAIPSFNTAALPKSGGVLGKQ